MAETDRLLKQENVALVQAAAGTVHNLTDSDTIAAVAVIPTVVYGRRGIRPIGRKGVIRVPTGITWAIQCAEAYKDTELDNLPSTGNNWACVICDDTLNAFLLPANLLQNIKAGAQIVAQNGDVLAATMSYAQRRGARPIISTGGVAAFDENGNVNVQMPAGGKAKAILQAAGTINGTAVAQGISDLDGLNTGANRVAIGGGARGWIVAGREGTVRR